MASLQIFESYHASLNNVNSDVETSVTDHVYTPPPVSKVISMNNTEWRPSINFPLNRDIQNYTGKLKPVRMYNHEECTVAGINVDNMVNLEGMCDVASYNAIPFT